VPRFSDLSLKVQLLLSVVAAGFVSFSVLTVIEVSTFARIQSEDTWEILRLGADAGFESVDRAFEDMGDELETLAARSDTVGGLRALSAAFAALGPDATGDLQQAYNVNNGNPVGAREGLADAGRGTPYDTAHATLHPRFAELAAEWGAYDLFLIDRDLNIVYSVEKESDFGASLAQGELAGTGLADVVRRAMDQRDDMLSAFEPYAPSAGQDAAFLAVPVLDEADAVIGALAMQVSPEVLGAALSGTLQAGIAAQYLLDADGQVQALNVADGFWRPELGTDSRDRLGLVDVSSEADLVVELTEGSVSHLAVRPGEIEGVPYTVAIASDGAVARAALLEFVLGTVGLALLSLVIIGLAGYLFGRRLIRPLSVLIGAVGRLQKGDLSFDLVGKDRGDEVGALSRAVEQFRQQEADNAELRTRQIALGAACESASAALLMVDADMRITFINAAAIRLMQSRIHDFRQLEADFDPNALIGRCADVFHKGAQKDYIREVLAKHELLPINAEIRVGRALLQLKISQIVGGRGGLVIEWVDLTDTLIQTRMYETSNANQFILQFGPDWSVVGMNRKFTQSTGHAFVRNPATRGQDLLDVSALGVGSHAEVYAMLQSEGELTGRLQVRTTDGESQLVLGTLTLVRDSKDRPFRIVMVGHDITAEETARVEAAAERERTQVEQQTVVEHLKRGLAALSEGDLTASLDVPFPGTYEVIRQDFNRTAANLCRAVQSVAENASQIQGETAAISAAAENLAHRTEKQASTLEETASALDEITKSVAQSSDRANRADGLVTDALKAASSGSRVVLETVAAMDAIETSSKQISRITSVIDDIAFQTNLLALNAGVEAARAGDAGRGFAVVASEVRALAQRSSAAAREISGLIAESGSQVTRGVALAGQAGEALRGIEVSFTEIAREVAEISSSSQSQSAGLVEINSAMSDLDQVTQQNAAMFEETSAAGHALRQETSALLELMRQFRTGGQVEIGARSQNNRSAASLSASADAGTTPSFRRRPAAARPAADGDLSAPGRRDTVPPAQSGRRTAVATALATQAASPAVSTPGDGWEDF